MKRANLHHIPPNRAWCQCTVGMLVLVFWVLLPSTLHAQRAQVIRIAPSSIGGTTQGGSFTLRSSAGEAAPVGKVQGGSFGVGSGWIYTVPSEDALLIVTHTPLGVQPLNQEVPVFAAVDDPASVELAQLFYRRGEEASFTAVEMQVVDGQLMAPIPGSVISSTGAAYYLNVADRSGRTRRIPQLGVHSVRVAVPEPGVMSDKPVSAGSGVSDYRIISIPLDLDDKNAEAVLVDDLGPYDDTRWRFFQLLFDQTLREFPATSAMEPGRAFWLIASDGNRVIDSGAGTTMDLSRAFSMPLHPGWNLVGSPFNFPIPIGNVQMKSGQPFLLRSFSGSWNDPIQAPVEVMQPFSGYAIFNNLRVVDELLIDPNVSAAKGASRLATLQPDWAIRITARSGRARDVDNLAAVAGGAQTGHDVHDYPEPPVVGQFVSVYFPHPEWGMPTERYATDVRPEDSQGHVWQVEVRGNVVEPVTMQFEGLAQVPADFDVWLVDEILEYAQDLRAAGTYSLSSVAADLPRRLQLVVGNGDFVKRNIGATRLPSTDYELLPGFPNPFYAGTTIRYVLPSASTVTLKIYDVVGREVAVLARNEPREAGHHASVWNGLGRDGVPLSSGLYYVHLSAAGRSLTTAVVKTR